MMDNVLIPFVVVILEVLFAIVVWSAAEGSVAKQCEKIGAFAFDDQVYECKLKNRLA